ncbi:MAG: carbon storage regulator CsrA [Lachnospiraceae bacterium]|nr:carbon storage regulator CsrA [Lachnospiraceae bacterium]
MLALTRKKDEALVINNNIEIKIHDIKGDQIKLGVQAPRDISVYRKEIYLQIQEANKEAMSADAASALNDLI